MNILALGNCELSPFLGSGKTRIAWSSGLRERGHTVEVLQPSDFEFCPALRLGKRFRMAYGARAKVLSLIRKREYDLIEFFGGEFGWVTRALAAMKKRPLIVAHTDGIELIAFHGGAFPPERMPALWNPRAFSRALHHRLDYSAFRYADRFVTGSQEDRNYAIARGLFAPENARAIAPGIDAEFLARPFAPGDGSQIAYLGTWTERKNPAVIASAITAVLHQRPNTVFHIFGAADAGASIKAVFPSSIHDRVRVHPKLSKDELVSRVSQCGIFFFPSIYEGFGMALAEAMGCGCAAVTTPTGFGAELLNGEQALVCAAHDTAGLEAALLRMIDDGPLRARIGRAGWERVQELLWKNQVAKLEQAYLQWLKEWPGEA